AAPFQLMPPLSAAEYAERRADIEAHGVQVPIIVDEHGRVIDGHHRQQIAQALGLPCPWTTVTSYTDTELRDMSLRLNLHRRHLTSEQKRAALAASIMADPGLSDRQHAARVGASPTTAGDVRRDMQNAGDVSTLDTRTDSTGRQQPATKVVNLGVVQTSDSKPRPGTSDRPAILRGTRRLVGDRIIGQAVEDAANLMSPSLMEQVDYRQLDRDKLADWVSSLAASRKNLLRLEKTLREELAGVLDGPSTPPGGAS
ncbi:MAG: ParB N-terminal domain-containing protein, partial [Actinomycetota bacterium]|nr:ParB N-terminal domain-containing protein [Actinomycetota bacterium]